MQRTLDVAILGARGMIGQQYMNLLSHHPWFHPHPIEVPEEAADYPLTFSALPTEAAMQLEPQLVAAGARIISSAAAHRMAHHVPMIIPEVNADHLTLLSREGGWLVTKPNCTVHTFLLPLAPLHRHFHLTQLHITSLQALSGAGKKGLEDPWLRQHVACLIPGEEEKCITEPTKLLGYLREATVIPAPIAITAHCNRVPVTQGHLVCISATFQHPFSLDDVLALWESQLPLPLPSSPPCLITLDTTGRPTLPLDGMSVVCSRPRQSHPTTLHFSALAHNLIRGGAGAGVLTAELMCLLNYA